MSKHTPGPWRFDAILTASENHRGWNVARDHDGFGGYIGTVSPKIKDDSGNAGAEGIANARLIAAAPDLLEALIDATEALAHLQDRLAVNVNPPTLDKARAAISKATGEQQ